MTRRLALALLLAVPLLVAALGARVTNDVLRLLPADAGTAEAVRTLRAFGATDVLLFDVDGTGAEPAALDAAATGLAADLRSLPGITRVDAGLSLEDALAIREVAAAHAPALIPETALRRRTSLEGMHRALGGWLAELSGPGGALAEARLVRDPLRLEELALESLGHGAPGRVERRIGALRSEEGLHALVIATTEHGPTDVSPGDPFVASLHEVAARQALPVVWFGGHRIAAATADGVRRDVKRAVGFGSVALVLVLLVGFRRVAPLLGALGPLGLAVLATAGVAGLISPLHGIQVAFVAMLAGLAVDYWIHLYLGATAIQAGEPTLGRAEAALRALAELRGPLWMSAGSTALAFGALALSRVPLVHDLGLLGLGATLGAALGTVLLGPLAFAAVGPGPEREPGPPRRRPTLAALLAVGAVVLGLYGLGGTLDTDADALLSRPAEIVALERHFADTWGLGAPRGMAVVEGPDPDVVRDRAGRVEQALAALGFVASLGPGGVLPGPDARAAREAALSPAPILQARLDSVAGLLGFAPFPEAAAHYHALAAAPLPVDAWDDTALAARARRHLVATRAGWAAMVTVPLDDPTVEPLLADTVAAADPGARWVVPTDLAGASLADSVAALVRVAPWVALTVFLLLWVRTGRARDALRALAPVAAGTAAAAGAMALAGLAWNIVSLAGLVLLLGLSLDYGVFTVEARTPERAATTRRAIALGAATTLAGFAALTTASSPALVGLGVAVTAGTAMAAAVPLVVLPALEGPATGLLGTVRRWGPRLAWVGVIALQIDALLGLWFAYRPPEAPEMQAPPVVVDGAEQRAGLARLLRTEGLRVLYTEGAPYESGLAYGALTADLRHRVEEELFASFRRHVPNPAARWLVTRGSLVLGHPLRDAILPAHLVQLRGVADAAPDRWWFKGSPFTRRVYYHALHDLGQALVDTPLVVACTGFVAGGSATADGHWLLARNFDFEGGIAFDRDKVVWVHRPDDGVPFVAVGFAGMLGAVTGVNAEGIAVAINAAGSDVPIRPGTPMTLIIREILQTAGSLDEAEAILRARTGFVSENVMVVDGEAGEAALFEVTPAQVVRVPVPEWIAVSNHFRSEAFAGDATNAARMRELTTVPRLARMEELVGGAAGDLDPARAARILVDRRGVGDTPLARGHRHALNADIATHGVVIDATARTLWVSRYPNLSAGFVAFDLDAMLEGDLAGVEVVPPEAEAARALAIARGRELLRAARRTSARRALPLVRDALREMPDHPEALYETGRVLWALGERDEARPYLGRALAGPPEYAWQEEAIQALLEAE